MVGNSVCLGDRSVVANGCKMVRNEMHRRVVSIEKPESPRNELCDRSAKRTMSIGGILMKAACDKLPIEAINAAAVGENEIANRLAIGKCLDVGGANGGGVGAHSRGGYVSAIIVGDLWGVPAVNDPNSGPVQETPVATSVEPDVSRWQGIAVRVRDAARALRERMSWGGWMALVLGLATLISRAPGLIYNGMFDRDESYLAVIGDVLRNGGQLYIDTIDRKPPVVPVMYSLIREWSVDMRAIRIVVAVLIFLNGVVVTEIVRRLSRSRRAALFAGVLAIVGTALFLPPDAQAANFELWGLLPASAAILCVVIARSERRSTVLWFALAGASVVIAANCKQPYIVVGLPVAFEALRRGHEKWQALSATVFGAIVSAVPLFVFFDGQKMIRWVWSDNSDYLNGGISIGRAAAIGVALSLVFVLLHLPLFYGVWAVLRRRVRADYTVLIWIGVSVLTIPIGLRFFGHYYQQLVPPLAVLTGCALVTAKRRVWQALTVLTAGLLVAMLGLAFIHRPDLTNYTALGRYVQSTTTPDQRILVWGALPDVYVSSERLPSGIFLHDGYLTGNWASRAQPLPQSVIAAEPFRSRWDMFFEDVAVNPPAVVINAARPETDWERYGPESFPIGSWLNRCYDLDRVVDGLSVWRRDTASCPM